MGEGLRSRTLQGSIVVPQLVEMECALVANTIEILVPDIGEFDEVEVVELLVAPGDAVAVDDGLVSIESDKATMEIPSTHEGVISEVRVALGDRVSEGNVLVLLDVAQESDGDSDPSPDESTRATDPPAEAAHAESEEETDDRGAEEAAPSRADDPVEESSSVPQASSASQSRPGRLLSAAAAHPVPDRAGLPHASPLVRRYARELGVPVESADGSGPHGRVLVDDLKEMVRERFSGEGGASVGGGIPAIPAFDASAFGPVREEPLTRIQKVSGPALQRSWLNAPHVTQYDESDITALEEFRRERKALAAERGVKLSPLLFVMKALVVTLRDFPSFRSSLAPTGDHLIIKDYFHLGVAVDTEQGLVVPVIRDVDRKGVFELAEELAETAQRARDRKLTPDDMKGACFTISSLGGIGGTAFSPIVNVPEVAILGLSKTRVEPVWTPQEIDEAKAVGVGGGGDAEKTSSMSHPVDGSPGRFEPRLILPFSLSYDHRVIDGAIAARFTTRLAKVLRDPLQLLL